MNSEIEQLPPHCGLHVPTKEEIDLLGIERQAEHPNFSVSVDDSVKEIDLEEETDYV